MKILQYPFLALILAIGLETGASEIVKKTSSGICHPPASSYYDRTTNFHAFDSIEACLASDGRLPKSLALSDSSQSPINAVDSYDRSAFGPGWDDADGDCQDSRAEALVAASNTTVRFATERACRVVTGRWISPFTGEILQNSSEIDIDHVVPLRWAWEHGAKDWSKTKREKFANDMINLWPVELGLNRSKGAQPPSDWLPPSSQCGYVARFTRIVKKYGLEPSQPETKWLRTSLDHQCRLR